MSASPHALRFLWFLGCISDQARHDISSFLLLYKTSGWVVISIYTRLVFTRAPPSPGTLPPRWVWVPISWLAVARHKHSSTKLIFLAPHCFWPEMALVQRDSRLEPACPYPSLACSFQPYISWLRGGVIYPQNQTSLQPLSHPLPPHHTPHLPPCLGGAGSQSPLSLHFRFPEKQFQASDIHWGIATITPHFFGFSSQGSVLFPLQDIRFEISLRTHMPHFSFTHYIMHAIDLIYPQYCVEQIIEAFPFLQGLQDVIYNRWLPTGRELLY